MLPDKFIASPDLLQLRVEDAKVRKMALNQTNAKKIQEGPRKQLHNDAQATTNTHMTSEHLRIQVETLGQEITNMEALISEEGNRCAHTVDKLIALRRQLDDYTGHTQLAEIQDLEAERNSKQSHFTKAKALLRAAIDVQGRTERLSQRLQELENEEKSSLSSIENHIAALHRTIQDTREQIGAGIRQRDAELKTSEDMMRDLTQQRDVRERDKIQVHLQLREALERELQEEMNREELLSIKNEEIHKQLVFEMSSAMSLAERIHEEGILRHDDKTFQKQLQANLIRSFGASSRAELELLTADLKSNFAQACADKTMAGEMMSHVDDQRYGQLAPVHIASDGTEEVTVRMQLVRNAMRGDTLTEVTCDDKVPHAHKTDMHEPRDAAEVAQTHDSYKDEDQDLAGSHNAPQLVQREKEKWRATLKRPKHTSSWAFVPDEEEGAHMHMAALPGTSTTGPLGSSQLHIPSIISTSEKSSSESPFRITAISMPPLPRDARTAHVLSTSVHVFADSPTATGLHAPSPIVPASPHSGAHVHSLIACTDDSLSDVNVTRVRAEYAGTMQMQNDRRHAPARHVSTSTPGSLASPEMRQSAHVHAAQERLHGPATTRPMYTSMHSRAR
jgi:hypothetical protein